MSLTLVAPATFPDSWKQALVVPIPKIGDPTKVANYRPISQPGKIMEKIVYQKLMSYIEKNYLLSDVQHDFGKNKSTLDALFQLTSQINVNLDTKKPTLVTFIDFKKVFDCVQHKTLVEKIEDLQLDNLTCNWFKSYLTNHSQKVIANNQLSQEDKTRGSTGLHCRAPDVHNLCK